MADWLISAFIFLGALFGFFAALALVLPLWVALGLLVLAAGVGVAGNAIISRRRAGSRTL